MKIILISDTHGLHSQLKLPEGDMLIHAGDVSLRGTKEQVEDFLNWFTKQPHPHKILIAGNHDFFFEDLSPEDLKHIIPENIHYLNGQLLEINGLRIWGSPVTPIPNKRWAFNRDRGEDIQKQWDLIPENLDILIVHGPPHGILDQILNGDRVGCENLRETVFKLKPQLMTFGHIHEDRGIVDREGTIFVNASSVDRYRTKVHPPYAIEFKGKKIESVVESQGLV